MSFFYIPKTCFKVIFFICNQQFWTFEFRIYSNIFLWFHEYPNIFVYCNFNIHIQITIIQGYIYKYPNIFEYSSNTVLYTLVLILYVVLGCKIWKETQGPHIVFLHFISYFGKLWTYLHFYHTNGYNVNHRQWLS